MRVHVLLLRDQYDSDLLGVYADAEAGRAAGDRRFAALARAPWRRDARGGLARKLGSDGAYLWLRPADVDGAA
jgi:hypothetical protein